MSKREGRFSIERFMSDPIKDRSLGTLENIHSGLYQFLDDVLGRPEGWKGEIIEESNVDKLSIKCLIDDKDDQNELYTILLDHTIALNNMFFKNNQPYFIMMENMYYDDTPGEITLEIKRTKKIT